MSATTPLRPLEIPPFALHAILSPIFTLSAPSLPTSPTRATPSSPPPRGRLSQLVSGAGGGAGPGAATGAGDLTKLASVRSVEASGQRVWVGASDGQVRIYEVGDGPVGVAGLVVPGEGRSVTPEAQGSPTSSSGRRTPSGMREPVAALTLVEEVVVTLGKKAADRIALMERIGKVVILSEGVLTFHSLPSLAPLSVHAFPAMKGVTTFSLDEAELAGGGSPDAMHVCAIRRRSIHLIKVTKDGAAQVKELPLRGGALVSVYRNGHLCIADAENYSIVDLNAAISTPLLPISQSPNTDDRPISMSSVSSAPPPGGIDPRQRPAIACVGANEFLIASHTGNTTLGVFVTETGEPTRGTLEWGSNLRSVSVDAPYVIALLYNNTLEVHSIHTQEIVQVLPLPPSSSSPFALQPRSLLRSWSGLDLGAATGANKVDLVGVPLLPRRAAAEEPPRTPTRSGRGGSSSLADSLQVHGREGSAFSSGSGPGGGGQGNSKGPPTRTLLVGKNSLYALTPLTLVVQADALMDRGRVEEAVALAAQIESSGNATAAAVGEATVNPEVAYVYLRAAYIALGETLFQDAFGLFLRSACDPRLVVRMFPDLREPLMREEEEVVVCQGVRMEVMAGRTVDDYIMANLTRNYSPHIKPDVESASPTVELRSMLGTTARDALRSYLIKWREARRSTQAGGSSGAGDSRKVDMVVDTALVRLLTEEGRAAELVKILDGPNDCVLQVVEPALLDAGLYQVLASLQLKRGELVKTLDIWFKIVDGEYVDATFVGGPRQIFDLLRHSKDKPLVEKYGVWLLQRDRVLGLKLFTDPKQTLTFDTRELFAQIRVVDAEAADLFLESTVLQKRDTDSRLHADLVKRYIDRLGELLADPLTKAHLRDQESAYLAQVARSSSSPPSFLFFLASSYAAGSPHADFDRVRLKTILFLGTSSSYDVAGTKSELDAMEMKGLRGLTLERAIVYGKLHLDRQALSFLLHSLQDLTSSEMYCHQSGDPLLASDVSAAAARLSMPLPRRKKSAAQKEGDEGRKAGLARLLVEMCLVERGAQAEEGGLGEYREGKKEQVARILETQAIHLDTLEVLPLLPPQWPLALLTPFLARSLRRSLHERQEASLLKALALSQNLAVSERLGDAQVRKGAFVQTTPEDGPPLVPEALVRLVEKKEKAQGDLDTVELDLR